MKSKEALHLFLSHKLSKAPNSTQIAQDFAFWRIGHILHLAQFMSYRYHKSSIACSFALKPLYYAEPKIVVFYLP